MIRTAALIVLTFAMVGCSTIGDIEVVNDIGPVGKSIGTTARTIDSSCKVLTGHSCDRAPNTAQINRTYGEIKQLPDYKAVPLATQLAEIITIFGR